MEFSQIFMVRLINWGIHMVYSWYYQELKIYIKGWHWCIYVHHNSYSRCEHSTCIYQYVSIMTFWIKVFVLIISKINVLTYQLQFLLLVKYWNRFLLVTLPLMKPLMPREKPVFCPGWIIRVLWIFTTASSMKIISVLLQSIVRFVLT